ncbi:tripartite tricarboxylate transporter substrate binding protein [Xenophilus sp. Marseille-Q4582]|uniref:Bug family tripartite tricarboxylate transporter substrate binding protein n=1 Tax=Xenophilus sp. Marseille-Q4582 TaxID=2866600 RepID=UPI001CE4720B|nr:tripartite tricarboxylate transporter substrate binding protein [Xenophilus sp. Marseille-Q4582]
MPHDPCRRLLLHAGAAGLALAAAGAAARPAWPARPVTLVVGFPAGGITDVMARLVSKGLADELKQPVVIDNRSGAGGTIAAAAVAAAPKDGYTLLVVASGHVHNRLLLKGIRYDALADFEPIGGIAQNQLVLLVNPASAHQKVQDLIAAARTREITYGSGTIGGVDHLLMEELAVRTQGRFVGVQYRGAAPAFQDLLGGQIDVYAGLVQAAVPYIEAGKLRALALTSRDRSPLLPQVPTLSETVLSGYDAQGYFGLVGPAGLPAPVVARLNQALNQVLQRPEVLATLRQGGARPLAGTPAEFQAFLRQDGLRWSDLITRLHIQPQ